MGSLYAKGIVWTLIGAAVMAALIVVAAGTFDYWQAWVFMAVFEGSSIALGIYLAIYDPQLLARRMRVGPAAEQEKTQKVIMTLALIGFIAIIVVPAFDRRFGWSSVPTSIVLIGNVLIAVGFLVTFFVFRENSYGASTIQIAEGQRVISTGPYALVRHPMYSGVLVMMLGMPLALGSWWGLLAFLFFVPILAWRLLDEERFLKQHLTGYVSYTQRVQFRLVPFVW